MERCLVVSCEHGGHRVPAGHAALFTGQETVLASHRGWDAGGLQLGRQMADALGATFHASTTTRLLVDLNRSIGHRQLFSEFTRGLPPTAREAIVTGHYRPHREAVEDDIGLRIASGAQVIHIASHSFTPVLDGVVRRADVAWLYDPRREGESTLTARWRAELALLAPGLHLRRNYPYRGTSDGLTTLLRKRFCATAYVGIELEVNQRFFEQGGPRWRALRSSVIESLARALAVDPPFRSPRRRRSRP